MGGRTKHCGCCAGPGKMEGGNGGCREGMGDAGRLWLLPEGEGQWGWHWLYDSQTHPCCHPWGWGSRAVCSGGAPKCSRSPSLPGWGTARALSLLTCPSPVSRVSNAELQR